VALAALVLTLAPAQADTTCTVTSLDDSGDGTLRDRIGNTACDVIVFDPDILPGTITLDSQLTISRSLAIDGPGVGQLTISGNNAVRVFEIEAGSMVTISGVTIAQGQARGRFPDNSGGGIRNVGSLTVTNSTISGNTAQEGGGGGILNVGTLTVTSSTISNNTASFAGGILNVGTVTVTNSTISDNTALTGGGIWNLGDGTVMVTNSTISDNTASDTGGGISNSGTLTAKNSIVANSSSGGNCLAAAGTFTALGVNLADDGLCPGFDEFSSAEINLGPLADNGGPTFTHALLPGSVAINAATDCTLVDGETPVTTDQRGVTRPQGPACDAGAFELEKIPEEILDFFDDAVAKGELKGSGPGRSAEGRLKALRNMLEEAEALIQQGDIKEACGQLRQAYLRTDGEPRPPDFVEGPAAGELAQMILDLMDDLGCS
jgi:hypothetical protein